MSGVNKFEAHYLAEGIMGGKALAVAQCVLASDYDRDTQALKDELDNIKLSWGLILSQRDALIAENERLDRESHNTRIILVDMVESRDQLKDENDRLRQGVAGDFDLDAWIEWAKEAAKLRAENEALRDLLTDARRYVDKAWPDGVHSYRTNSVSGDLLSKIDAALQGDKT